MTSEIGVPSRSDDGLANLSVFYASLNNVHFYVEDQDQENLYLEIFRKVFPRFKLARVFPLNGKKNVLDRAASEPTPGMAGPEVFVVDKDFDDLLGTMVEQPNVIYLERYCIENYLLEEQAIVEIVVEEYPKRRVADIEATLNFSGFVRSTVRSLDELFRMFYLVQRHSIPLANCKTKPEQYCVDSRRHIVDDAKVDAYRDQVLAHPPYSEGVRLQNEVDSAFGSRRVVAKHISGKYLLNMTMHYLRNSQGVSISCDSLKFRLARHCSFRSLKEFRRQVLSYLGGV